MANLVLVVVVVTLDSLLGESATNGCRKFPTLGSSSVSQHSHTLARFGRNLTPTPPIVAGAERNKTEIRGSLEGAVGARGKT